MCLEHDFDQKAFFEENNIKESLYAGGCLMFTLLYIRLRLEGRSWERIKRYFKADHEMIAHWQACASARIPGSSLWVNERLAAVKMRLNYFIADAASSTEFQNGPPRESTPWLHVFDCKPKRQGEARAHCFGYIRREAAVRGVSSGVEAPPIFGGVEAPTIFTFDANSGQYKHVCYEWHDYIQKKLRESNACNSGEIYQIELTRDAAADPAMNWHLLPK